jgi:hypothetical protein
MALGDDANRLWRMPGLDMTPTQNTLAPPPTQAQAWQFNAQAAQDWLDQQRKISSDLGLWNDQTGLPTGAGIVNAGQQYGNALLMGTTTPGIRAFHGSPYDFEQFDTSKIGTGEGAQAYGHGLYFAEKEGTAQSYRDALTPTDAGFNAMDTVLGRFAGWNPSAADVREALTGHDVLTPLADNPDVVDAVRRLSPDYNPSGAVTGDALRHYRTINDAIEAAAPKGKMYEVNIGADPEQFLHWDKPLSEQSPQVQQRVASLQPPTANDVAQLPNGRWSPTLDGQPVGRPDGWPDKGTAQYVLKAINDDAQKVQNMTGEQFYNRLATSGQYGGRNQADAAAALQQAGIPGIKYLDQGSRSAGQGTHNYVVFDANTIDILRKYGIAGLMAGSGAAAVANGSQPQQ